MHVTSQEYKKKVKKLGYKGCKNCIHSPDTCKESGRLHLICPKWSKNDS